MVRLYGEHYGGSAPLRPLPTIRNEENPTVLKDFRDFIMKGNVLDLAVAVIIGAAFGAVIVSLVDNVLNPIIAGVFGQPDLSETMTFDVGDATVRFGAWLNAIISFLIIAGVIFLIIRTYEKMQERRGVVPEEDGPSDEVVLLTEIRDALKAQN